MKRLMILTFLALSSCRENQQVVECSAKPTMTLERKNVTAITLTSQAQTFSGLLNSDEAKGYTFTGLENQKLDFSAGDRLCFWLYTPSQTILKDSHFPEDGTYLLQITRLQGAGSYEFTLSLDSPSPPSPSPSPSPLPPASTSPREALEQYFSLLQAQNYKKAWNMLTPSQQSDTKLRSNGYISYTEWWDTVAQVELTIISTEEKSDQASVDTKVVFRQKNGTINRQKLRFFLLPINGEWKINKVKLI